MTNGHLTRQKTAGGNLTYLNGTFRHTTMKVRASVRTICRNCKIIRRHGRLRVICQTAKHKQRQG